MSSWVMENIAWWDHVCEVWPMHRITVRRRNQQHTDTTDGIQEENLCLEDILGLSVDPDDSDEDKGIIDY